MISSSIVSLLVISSFFGAIYPGPNTMLIISTSLENSIFQSVKVILGIRLGILSWIIMLLLGIENVLSNQWTKIIFSIGSAGYLLFLSYNIFISTNSINRAYNNIQYKHITQGFIISILNIEIPIFYGIIISSIILNQNEISNINKAIYIFIMMLVEVFVHCSLAMFVNKLSIFVRNYTKIIKKVLASTLLIYASILLFYVYSQFIK